MLYIDFSFLKEIKDDLLQTAREDSLVISIMLFLSYLPFIPLMILLNIKLGGK